MSKQAQSQRTGNPRHLADSHLSEKRSPGPQGKETKQLPQVRVTDDGRHIAQAHMALGDVTVVVSPVPESNSKLLSLSYSQGGPIVISSINQVQNLIDALYAVASSWTLAELEKGKDHGHK